MAQYRSMEINGRVHRKICQERRPGIYRRQTANPHLERQVGDTTLHHRNIRRYLSLVKQQKKYLTDRIGFFYHKQEKQRIFNFSTCLIQYLSVILQKMTELSVIQAVCFRNRNHPIRKGRKSLTNIYILGYRLFPITFSFDRELSAHLRSDCRIIPRMYSFRVLLLHLLFRNRLPLFDYTEP